MTQSTQLTPSTFSLRQIAAWQLPDLVHADAPQPSWVAELPSLQREAVWRPWQIELIWDSIFRGFPIGSLVISEHLKNQKGRSGKVARTDNPWPDMPKRHLLDGQQRYNAIALGHWDPFRSGAESESTKSAILWIDLSPPAGFPAQGSTRHFLFRVTTPAHPWGYMMDDEAKLMSAAEIRLAVEKYKWKPPPSDPYKRPAPCDIGPYKADAPIPLSWLLLEWREDKVGPEFWEAIRLRCQKCSAPWARNFELPDVSSRLKQIENGLLCAMLHQIVALEVPDETISAESLREGMRAKDGSPDEQNIANVEHLFQRLNNAGTRISPDDLRYSMIKAYWPGIESKINDLGTMPMRASQLALLAIRAALASSEPPPEKLPPGLSITAVRTLASAKEGEEKHVHLGLVKKYFGFPVSGAKTTDEPPTQAVQSMLLQVVARIEEWLLYRDESEGGKLGLPPVLRTSLARGSGEVYLLLMVLAQRAVKQEAEGAQREELRLPILGLVTALHWFSFDKKRAVERVYARLRETQFLTPSFFARLLRDAPGDEKERTWLLPLPTPHDLSDIITEPNEQNLKTWQWSTLPKVAAQVGGLAEDERRRELLRSFLSHLKEKRELLIYAQREYMWERFKDFDQGDPSAWEDHNRPWDYDHLLPHNHFFGGKDMGYKKVCAQWGNTISNLHVLSFEENRARGTKDADSVFREENCGKMLLNDKSPLVAFTFDGRSNYGANKVLPFARAARERLLAMYKDWFDNLGIAFLLGEPETPIREHDPVSETA